MSKKILQDIFANIKTYQYAWSLYFFRIDRRNNQPYKTYKVRFRNFEYLASYARNLLSVTEKFQVEPISCVQEYDGENTKVTCDKLALENELISSQWKLLYDSIVSATDTKIEGKLNGYILVGQPQGNVLESVTFVKIANPVTNLNNKKSVVFSSSEDDELSYISDDVYRLYLTVDFIVYADTMYTFNHSFEKLFNIETTMSKVKDIAIEKMICLDGISNPEEFRKFAGRCSSTRTFITLNEERMKNFKDGKYREKIVQRLNLALDGNMNFVIDENGKIVIDDEKKAELLIQYLCYKIFIDGETNDLLGASTVTRISDLLD